MHGQAFDQLRELIAGALTELERRRFELRRATDGKTIKGHGMFDDFDIEPVADFVRHKYPDDRKLGALVGARQRRIDRGIKRVREVLARYVRYAALGLIVDGVIHDSSEPIGAIVSESQLASDALRRESGKSRLHRELVTRLGTIQSSAALAASVIERIAPFGGRKRGRPKRIQLERAIAAGCELLATQVAEAGVRLELPSTSTMVTADPVEIQEIILNLLSNSLYWLRSVPKSKRVIRIEVRRLRDDAVRILFSDSGPGIDPDIRDRVFEPYFSTKPRGSGLGLTIVGDLVSNYYRGEAALVDSADLGGATFQITLRRRV
jgi:C4-dicarboxylate-specific signal transduction histidine kinase